MKDIMLADTPVEQRAQILRDSCDEVVEKSYLSSSLRKKLMSFGLTL